MPWSPREKGYCGELRVCQRIPEVWSVHPALSEVPWFPYSSIRPAWQCRGWKTTSTQGWRSQSRRMLNFWPRWNWLYGLANRCWWRNSLNSHRFCCHCCVDVPWNSAKERYPRLKASNFSWPPDETNWMVSRRKSTRFCSKLLSVPAPRVWPRDSWKR